MKIRTTGSPPNRRSTTCSTICGPTLLGFAGIEMHRRILGLAHNADFEDIADEKLRASCEAPALKFGRHIVVNRNNIQSLAELDRLAEALDQGKLS